MADRDTLLISELEARARLGVYEWEQERPQPVWIDLELAIDATAAARRDEMKDAVDYGRLVTAVKELVQSRPFHLMETMAEDVAALVLTSFRVEEVKVRVKKRALPGIAFAAVEISRIRREFKIQKAKGKSTIQHSKVSGGKF